MFFGKKSNPATPAPDTKTKDTKTKTAAATTSATNGGAPVAATDAKKPLSQEEAKKRAGAAKHVAASFGEIVTLLMRSDTDKALALRDLEWMVLPAVMSGQFALAEAQSKETGVVTPVAAVLWAFVSPEIDKRLSNNLTAPPRLAPAEWRSGNIPWIILALGQKKVLGGLLQQLAKTAFKDKPARIRARAKDGKVVVGKVELPPAKK
jgi:cytolysin-activating lysine-acyltransferase